MFGPAVSMVEERKGVDEEAEGDVLKETLTGSPKGRPLASRLLHLASPKIRYTGTVLRILLA